MKKAVDLKKHISANVQLMSKNMAVQKLELSEKLKSLELEIESISKRINKDRGDTQINQSNKMSVEQHQESQKSNQLKNVESDESLIVREFSSPQKCFAGSDALQIKEELRMLNGSLEQAKLLFEN